MVNRSFDKLRMSRGLRRSFPRVRVSGDFCKTSGATLVVVAGYFAIARRHLC